jgi:hypothetical protein
MKSFASTYVMSVYFLAYVTMSSQLHCLSSLKGRINMMSWEESGKEVYHPICLKEMRKPWNFQAKAAHLQTGNGTWALPNMELMLCALMNTVRLLMRE